MAVGPDDVVVDDVLVDDVVVGDVVVDNVVVVNVVGLTDVVVLVGGLPGDELPKAPATPEINPLFAYA